MSSRTDRLIETLWQERANSKTTVWALLDGARDDQIFPLLRDSGLDHLCLYSGALPRPLRFAAPYMVELSPAYSATRRLIDASFGNSWGIFLQLADPANLRPHLRKLLKVQDESRRTLLFRFYDPRVLRIFLPTCDSGQLQEMFGPISSFWAEGEDGRSVLEFRCDGQRLMTQQFQLD